MNTLFYKTTLSDLEANACESYINAVYLDSVGESIEESIIVNDGLLSSGLDSEETPIYFGSHAISHYFITVAGALWAVAYDELDEKQYYKVEASGFRFIGDSTQYDEKPFKSPSVSLQDDFSNDQPEHFTYYDYILQVNINGQLSSLKETLEELEDKALTLLLRQHGETLSNASMNALESEILKRMGA